VWEHCSFSEVYDYSTHVVAAFSLGAVDIRGQQGVKEALSDLGELDLALHLYVHVVYDLLAGFRLPDAVAAHDCEVSLARYLVNLYVWQRSDCLLVELELWVLLVSDVANSPGQVQVAINSALNVDSGAGPVDPLPLLFLVGLMVYR